MPRRLFAPALLLAACTTPHDPAPTDLGVDAIDLDAFASTTCAIDGGGVPRCFGEQLARPAPGDGTAPPPFTLPAPAVAIAVGLDHACAVLTSGAVACWGDNHDGGLTTSVSACPQPAMPGDPAPPCVVDPTFVPGVDAQAIDAGDDVTCALTTDARVLCWGDAAGGRLGHGALGVAAPASIDVAGAPIHAIQISLASRRGCAVTDDHALVCWGGEHAAPTRLDELGAVTAVAVGDDHACVVTAAGDVTCWGEDRNGQAGDLAIARKCGVADGPCLVGPTHVAGVARAVAVAVGARHSCATLADGTVACWGSNEWGQLGRTDAFLLGAPGRASLSGAAAITAGRAHTCVRTSDAHAWCFGLDDLGQIGGV